MSLLKRIFGIGGGAGDKAPAGPAKELEYKGFLILAEPYESGGQYQIAGTIEKRDGEEVKQHKFVRADRVASKDEAADFSIRKGCQIVDEQGDGMFR